MFLLLVAAAAAGAQGTEALGSRLSDLDRSAYSCTEVGARTLFRARGKSLEHLGLPILRMTLEYRAELLT